MFNSESVHITETQEKTGITVKRTAKFVLFPWVRYPLLEGNLHDDDGGGGAAAATTTTSTTITITSTTTVVKTKLCPCFFTH